MASLVIPTMNRLTTMLGGGDWTNLDEQCHLLEITDTPEELDMRGKAFFI